MTSFDACAFSNWPKRERHEVERTVQEACPALCPERRDHLLGELFFPVARWWADAAREAQLLAAEPFVASASGLPGTGKSTLVAAVRAILEQHFGLRVAGFSLDDIYLTQKERRFLAETVHPWLKSRGVPGTHDVSLGLSTLRGLLQAGDDDATPLPRFDKLADERVPPRDWPLFVGRPDIVLLEGWCWGAVPGDVGALDEPINQRERRDPQGVHRRYVHQSLGQYQGLFARSSHHVHLEAPSHASSVRWRWEQGRADRIRRGLDPNELLEEHISSFLELFERVGRLKRRTTCEVVVHLDERHEVVRITAPKEC